MPTISTPAPRARRAARVGLCCVLALLWLSACSIALDLEGPRAPGPPDGGREAGAPDQSGRADTHPPADGGADARADQGACVAAVERCNGTDDDCDGIVDEDWPQAGRLCTVGLGTCARPGTFRCAPSQTALRCEGEPGAPEAEQCNDLDDDCDGTADEGLAGCCEAGDQRACGSAVGRCSVGSQRCSDDQAWLPCDGAGPTAEVCDGLDQDCDGLEDEGVANACGTCGALAAEVCDGIDQDCDGAVDEGTLNACGGCGALPAEACDGVDQDCDGAVDEGALNACGACGELPAEVCDGIDQDCDGAADEQACHLLVFEERVPLPGFAPRWVGRTEGSRGPFDTQQTVQAAVEDLESEEVWVITDQEVWFYALATDTWRDHRPRTQVFDGLSAAPVVAASALPGWWIARFEGQAVRRVDLIQGDVTLRYEGEPRSTRLRRTGTFPLEGAWDEADAPDRGRIVGLMMDVLNDRSWWPGSPADLCPAGEARLGPVGVAFTDQGQFHVFEAGFCNLFFPGQPAAAWFPLSVPGAPDPRRIAGIAHFDYPEPDQARSLNVVLVR